MSSGWYKQQRDLFDRPWAKDAKMVSVYAYLHCCAYVQTGKLHGHLIRRGSCMTSRAAIMEATGLTEQEVKSRMNKLVSFGEIVVKPSSKGNIITVCDYDSCNEMEDIFSLASSNEDTSKDTTHDTTQEPTYIYKRNKKEEYISTYSPYNERERRAMVKEIQAKYNKMFEGRLPPYTKLYLATQLKVEECIRRFGRASVDLVLEQVDNEPFSLGKNNTGFIATFQFIFEPSEFQKYLERAQLRLKLKKKAQEQKPQQRQTEEKAPTGSWLDEYANDPKWRPGKRQ